MSATSAITRGRRMAESLMLDTVRVTRISGEPDPVTGESERTVVYEGKAKLQNQSQYEQDQLAGGHVGTIQRSLVHLPVGAFQMADGDLCTFLTSSAPFVAGQVYRLAGEAPYKTFETAYRVYADQVVA